MTMKRPGKQTAVLIEKLREEIIAGARLPNTPLRQDKLAEEYQVSRMPIREALRVLAAEGLVEIIPNRGARVAPIQVAEIKEIYEMRIAAETLAMRFAMPELNNRQIEMAKEINDEIGRANPQEYGRLNKKFHEALYTPCHMPRLLTHISELADVSDRYLRLTVRELDYAAHSNSEHDQLIDACFKRDADRALKILTKHIKDAGQALEVHLNKDMGNNDA
ncbi:GntR family transcriptional regulator [Curvivirga sp.]|uniref:GntR family transcriptional regulator n=1 Tax=Curvivirga sp. TaxID=2856848 RepID=UPI003B5ACFA9